MHKLLRYRNISETPNCSPTKIFGSVTKVFDGETWYPLPLWCIKFSIPQFLWSIERVPTTFFALWHQNFGGKNVIPLVCINFVHTPNFLKHWSDGHDFFRHSETKKFRRKNVTHLFIHKTFRNQSFFKNSSIPLWNFSVLWDNLFPIDICDIPLLCIEFFDTRRFLIHRRVPRKIFRHYETKMFHHKIVTPPCIKYKNQWWNWCL